MNIIDSHTNDGNLQGKNPESVDYSNNYNTELFSREQNDINFPFINREQSLIKVNSGFENLMNNRIFQSSIIYGDPGIGKTRLVDEFINNIPKQFIKDIAIYKINCNLQDKNTGYKSISDLMIKIFVGENRKDLREVIEDKLKIMGLANNLSEERISIIENLINPVSSKKFINLETEDPLEIRNRIFSNVKDIFLIHSSYKPTIIIFEDIQWMDDTTLELITFCCKDLKNTPVYLIFTIRPEINQPDIFKDLITILSTYRTLNIINLKSLEMKDILEMLYTHFTGIEKYKILLEKIIEKCDGNPFFLKEIIKSLIKENLIINDNNKWIIRDNINLELIPESIGEILKARVDNLSTDKQDVLSYASIFGPIFWKNALIKLFKTNIDNIIEELIREKIIIQKSPIIFKDEDTFSFNQRLMQETIYKNLDEEFKTSIHGKIADWMETKDNSNIANIIAEHYDKAGLKRKALGYYILAGNTSLNEFSYPEAINIYNKSLKIAEELKDSEIDLETIDILLNLRLIYYTLGESENTIRVLEKAKQIADRTGNFEICSKINLFYADYFIQKGDYKTALDYITKELQQAPSEEILYRARLIFRKGRVMFYINEIDEALEYYYECIDLFRKINNEKFIGHAYNNLAIIYARKKELRKALHYYKNALEISEKLDDKIARNKQLNNIGNLYKYLGEHNTALAYYRNSLTIAKTTNYRRGIGLAYTNIALLETEIGLNFHSILKKINKAIDIFKDIDDETNLEWVILAKLKYFALLNLQDDFNDLLNKYNNFFEKINNPENEMDYYFIKSFYKYQNQNYEDALKIIDKIFINYSENYGYYTFIDSIIHKFRLLFKLQKYKNIIRKFNEYEKTINSYPEKQIYEIKPFILSILSFSYLMEGKRNQSVEILRECEKIDLVKWIVSPLKIREINYYKYLVYKILGNTKKSKSCLNEAKKIILELADSINDKDLKLIFLKNNNTNNTILSE